MSGFLVSKLDWKDISNVEVKCWWYSKCFLFQREQKERKEQERAISSRLREKRHASARARRYYEDYHLRMRARMLKRRTKEEQVRNYDEQDKTIRCKQCCLSSVQSQYPQTIYRADL